MACNVLAEDGTVFSIVTTTVGDGPFNIVLDAVNFSDYAADDATVRIDPGRIWLGDLEIHLASARIWEPRFNWASFLGGQETLSHSTDKLKDLLVEKAPDESFVSLIYPRGPSVGKIEAQVLQSAQEPAHTLITGLLDQGEDLCRASARSLAGLGVGLTPDGDDFMMGCILAYWAQRAGQGVEKVVSWIVQEAAPRTTPISAAWLRAAGRGESSAHWHELLRAILAENENKLRDTAGAIIQQGHTSGASALAGFSAMLLGERQRAGLQ